MNSRLRIYEIKNEYIQFISKYQNHVFIQKNGKNKQKNRIRKNAEIVYSHKIHNGNETALAKRINDFIMLEKLCKKF